MTYDEFEATMLEAGWTLDEIERQWRAFDNEELDRTGADTWPTEDWDRD